MLSGVVFLDKPSGWTSRRAVNEVIRLLTPPGEKRIKAGHAGTLDPLATGMLPVLIGEGTRFASFGLNAEKVYDVTIDLGYQTDTLDNEGEVTGRFELSCTPEAVAGAVASFRGEYRQVPPQFSAIRIDGRRAHELARKGQTVAIEARPVTIHAIEILDMALPLLSLRVRCSKGTYIRSLARDIGEKLGAGGCVTSLRRISTGGWPAALMVTPEELEQRRQQCVVPLTQWLHELPEIELAAAEACRFLQGQRIPCADVGEGIVRVSSDSILLGTAEVRHSGYQPVLHPHRVLPSAQRSVVCV